MSSNLVKTFLELGDATSRNLKFSHRPDVYVSYGEETITETNLLEIRRRHSDRVYLETFPKKKESQSGADWEWHIIGDNLTLKMRVQAKRTQYKKCGLRIKYNQQRKLLLECARYVNMRPMYCIYCTEPQRKIWTKCHPGYDFEGYQTGCLLADANHVSERTSNLREIEHKCFPWHLLFDRDETGWDGPTIAELNENMDCDFNRNGVHETNRDDAERLSNSPVGQTEISDRGTHRIMRIDVRDQ